MNPTPAYLKIWSRLLAPYLLLLLITLPLLLVKLEVTPAPWYSEGYNLQVVRALLDRGLFATYNSVEGYLPLNPAISSGATIILPVQWSFRLFGIGILQARIITAVYALLAVFSSYACVSWLYQRQGALFITLFLLLLAVPTSIQPASFIMLGRQALGEMPGFALVMLGLWLWFRSWQSSNWRLAALAGLAFGLAVVSKPHVPFALLPTLVLIAGLRWIKRRGKLVFLATPAIISLILAGGWILIQFSGLDSRIQQEEMSLMAETLRVNFITGLWGRSLSRIGWVLAGLMIGAAGLTGWRLIRQAQAQKSLTDYQWGEMTLALIAFLTGVWFAFFSVGFEHYAFVGISAALLLYGKSVYDGGRRAAAGLTARGAVQSKNLYRAAVGFLAIGVTVINAYAIVSDKGAAGRLQETIRFVDQTIASNALVESTELELTSFTAHQEYHRPNDWYIYESIRQRDHEQRPVNLNYDALEADPDFLIAGPLSDFLYLYNPTLLADYFVKIEEFGYYRIYQRRREGAEK